MFCCGMLLLCYIRYKKCFIADKFKDKLSDRIMKNNKPEILLIFLECSKAQNLYFNFGLGKPFCFLFFIDKKFCLFQLLCF